MVSSIRVMVVLVLIFLSFQQEAQPKSSNPPIDLKPYLLRQEGREAAPDGFQLGFVGEAGHRLKFQFGAPGAVELEVSLGFPEGGVRTHRRLLEPGPKDTPVSFDLGPLLGNGPYRPLPAESRKGPQPKTWRPLPTGWWFDTHDLGNYLLTVKGRRVEDGEVLFLVDLRLPVQTWVGLELDRLAYIDDDEAEVELWLQKGAPVQELPVEVDLVEAKTGITRSSLSHRRLTRNKTRVPFDLGGLEAATYHVRVRPRIDGRLWDDGVRRALYLYRNGPAPKPDPPIEIPVAPQLFVDDYLIEDENHLERVFHPARKLGTEPLFRPDRPWEGFAVFVPKSSSVVFNQEERRYELEYVSLSSNRLLAVSSDGVHWTKPELGLVDFEGSRANNILEEMPRWGSFLEESGEFGGLWDYRTRGAPDLRTATLEHRPRGRDMHFQLGVYLMVRDPQGIRYLTSERPFMSRHLQLETLDSPTDNLGPLFYDERTGELVMYFAPHPPAHGKFLVRYDNKWAVSRNLGRMTTRDGVNWSRSYIWAPPREHPKHQSYGMQRVKQIGDLYIAFFPLYDCGTQKMDIHLWVSRNGIHWEDLGGDEAWIPNGPEGSHDHGIVYSLVGERSEGDRTRAFYHGTNNLHFNAWIRDKMLGGPEGDSIPESQIFDDETYNGRPYLSPPAPSQPGWAQDDCIWSWRRPSCSQTLEEVREAFWAELEASTGQTRADHIQKSHDYQISPAQVEFRTNGFASRRAGEQEGVLTTHPLVFQGSRLTINAAANKGLLVVEVLDEAGRPVPGYSREECLLETFDSSQQEVNWKSRTDLAALRGKPVRLRFYLQNADLYGFQIR